MNRKYIAKRVILHNVISRPAKFLAYVKNIDKMLVVTDKYGCNQIVSFLSKDIKVYEMETTMYNGMAYILHGFGSSSLDS